MLFIYVMVAYADWLTIIHLPDLGPVTEEGIFGNIGLGLLGEKLVSLDLENIYEHDEIEAETNKVVDHISGIWKKDRESYARKVENLERKMDEQTGGFISRDRKRKRKILEF